MLVNPGQMVQSCAAAAYADRPIAGPATRGNSLRRQKQHDHRRIERQEAQIRRPSRIGEARYSGAPYALRIDESPGPGRALGVRDLPLGAQRKALDAVGAAFVG